jgi:hypothetical protein
MVPPELQTKITQLVLPVGPYRALSKQHDLSWQAVWKWSPSDNVQSIVFLWATSNQPSAVSLADARRECLKGIGEARWKRGMAMGAEAKGLSSDVCPSRRRTEKLEQLSRISPTPRTDRT